MRATTFTLLTASAALAAAQLGNIPSCATSCITQALPASCNLSPSCICADTSFISTISCCVSTACDTAGQQAALAYAQSICSPVGVTNLPTAAACTGGAAASSGSSDASQATATGSSASSALSSASSALVSSASAVSSSRASSASSAASSLSSSATSATSSASSAAGSASSAASAASTSVVVQSTNAAPTMGPVVYAGVAALGALALL